MSKIGSRIRDRMNWIKKHIRQISGIVELFLAWCVLHMFRMNLLEQDIWLVCEKRNEARDNGYHFYKYLREEHPDVNAFYVITDDSPDYQKVSVLGNVIRSDSFRHCLYYLAAVNSVSSQAYGAFPFALNQAELRMISWMRNPQQKAIFLQHGVIKDELAKSAFEYGECDIDYFVCSAQREYEFVKKTYGYPDGAIGCIGLCRFDNLYRQKETSEKMVLVMPTWRQWHKRAQDGISLSEEEKQKFQSGEFYRSYHSLLTSKTLIDKLQKSDYKLYFYLHYQLQDYTALFRECGNGTVIIADRFHFDVQDLLLKAKILVTDYSSVFFDFGFMGKPLLYFHFDSVRFRESHYSKGYFDYERDGFGPCKYDTESLVCSLVKLIDSDGRQPEEYKNRVEAFFPLRDDKNCERTFQAVEALHEGR